MISINELRIGNLVSIENVPLGINTKEDKGIYKIISISNIINSNPCITAKNVGCGITVGSSIKNLEPIPLTPELLEKCGFDRLLFVYQKDRIDVIIDKNRIGIYPNFLSGMLIICKYLHQLQNMYYAITGEELEINA